MLRMAPQICRDINISVKACPSFLVLQQACPPELLIHIVLRPCMHATTLSRPMFKARAAEASKPVSGVSAAYCSAPDADPKLTHGLATNRELDVVGPLASELAVLHYLSTISQACICCSLGFWISPLSQLDLVLRCVMGRPRPCRKLNVPMLGAVDFRSEVLQS